MSEWESFNEKIWDEPGWVFCNTCGAKNRSDKGWYRRPRTPTISEYFMEARLRQLYPMCPDFAKHEYCCPFCWKKSHKEPKKCSVCKATGHNKRSCVIRKETEFVKNIQPPNK